MVLIRITSRFLCLSSAYRRNHYDTLGVSPKATYAEIKTAYYKLSMQYHPDRQDGNREMFEKITNAYKIIGDHVSRGLYDRGAFQDNSAPPPRNYYAKSGPQNRRPDVPAGKTPIYDFDMWSREHYGKTMERRYAAKARYDENANVNSVKKAQAKKENVILSVFIAFIFIGSLAYSYNLVFDNFDKPPKSNE